MLEFRLAADHSVYQWYEIVTWILIQQSPQLSINKC